MTDLKISKRPILFVAVLLITGVLVGQFFDFFSDFVMMAIISILLLSNLMLKNRNGRLLILSIVILLFGFYLSNSSKLENVSIEHIQLNDEWPVQVISARQKKDKIILTGLVLSDQINTRVLIQIKDSLDFTPRPGMTVRINSKLFEPGGARVPDGFDYRKYLSNQGIQLVTYPKYGQISMLKSGGQNLSAWSWHLSQIMMDKIDKIFSRSQSAPLVKGILLGFKEDMDSEERTLYSTAGIGHVFAVSGMHVGMVYLFCFPLLLFRNMGYGSKMIVPIFILCIVWLFILASGMTPSAVRAGTMISLFEIGKMLYRRIDKWNILAFTAIVAICFNPRVLHDIGFQFSYLALIGIFFFYGKFSSWFDSKNLLIKWSYNAIVLSAAAQLTLLPLSLYYFGNFSPYFWLSSLFAMFVVQVNFVLSFVALVLPENWLVLNFLVEVIDYLFLFLHDLIACIMKLPAAALSCKLEMDHVCLSYVMMIFIMMIWSSTRKIRTIKICTVIAMLLICADTISYLIPRSPELLVFNAENPTIRLQKGRARQEFCLDEFCREGFSSNIAHATWAVVSDKSSSCPDNTNILVLTTDCRQLDFLKELKELSHVVITGKIKWRQMNWLQEFCRDNHIVYHNLNTELIKINL